MKLSTALRRLAPAAAASVLLLVAGCDRADPPVLVRPSGQALVATVATGRVGDLDWRVEVVRQNGQLCTQSIVSETIMGDGCDATVAADRPVNIQVEGNQSIMFVYGVAGPSVARLVSRTTAVPAGTDLVLTAVPGDSDRHYFGYAAAPNSALDLVGYDATGKQIYSGGDKIRTADDK